MPKETQLDIFEYCKDMLKCTACGEYKPCSGFSMYKNSKRGYQYKCKVCKKQHREENIDYYKQWNKDNAEHIKEQHKQQSNTPFKSNNTSNALEEIKMYEPYIIDSDNDVNFKCAYCGVYFKATKQQIYNRLHAINGKGGSDGTEKRLYCSDQCKEECPVFNQQIHQKDHKPATSREVQPELRQIVLKRDNYTCQKCGWHKDDLSVGLHYHHIWPLNESPVTSADIDECITYCKNCHIWVHQNVAGCGYGEMKCIA